MQEMQPIYQSENLEVQLSGALSEGNGARLVTFESRNVSNKGKNFKPFGAPLALKFGIPILHVVPSGADWYNYRDMETCMAAIRPHLSSDAFSYGSSMGGYAAVRFADLLGVDRALAISPQASIQQNRVPFETRWQDDAARIKFRYTDEPSPRRATAWILLDQMDERELSHARIFEADGPTQILNVPYGGHPVGPALIEVGLLSAIVESFVKGKENAAELNEIISEKTRSSVASQLKDARTFRGKERAMRLRSIWENNPEDAKASFHYGMMLLRSGKVVEAEKALQKVWQGTKSRMRFRRIYSEECTALGIEPTLLVHPRDGGT